MKWRISLHPKNKEAERQKYHTFLHFDYCLALGISLMYYFILQIFLTVLNLKV